MLFIYIGTVVDSTTVITKNIDYLDKLVYSKSGHILINVKINGSEKEYPFILDNGSTTAIFDNLLDEFNLSKILYLPSRDANKTFIFKPVYKVNTMKIDGGITISDISVKSFDSDVFKCNKNVYGVIGHDIMKYFIWQFDFTNNTYYITSDTNTISSRINQITLPLNKFSDSRDYTEIFINNKKHKFLIDLGSTSSIRFQINTDSINVLFKNKNKKIIGVGGSGFNGKIKKQNNYIVLFDSIKINNDKFHKVKGSLSNKTGNMIGLEFLKNFKITFNYSKNKLTLESNDTVNFIPKRFGFKLDMIDNKLKIITIVENTLPYNSGLKVGDEIVKINEIRINEKFDLCNFDISKYDTLNLSIKRAEEIKEYKIIKDYYFK